MRRRVYVYFAATFLLGAIVGGAAVFHYAWSTGRWVRTFHRQVFIKHLTKDLHLTDGQVGQLQQIMDDAGKKFATVREQNDAQLDALRKETRQKIREILSADQVEKFDEISRRAEARRPHLSH